jgi:hypothetical protein
LPLLLHTVKPLGVSPAKPGAYLCFRYHAGEKTVFRDSRHVSGGQQDAIDKFSQAVPDGPCLFTRVLIKSRAEDYAQDFTFVPNRRATAAYYVVASRWGQVLVVIFLVMIVSYVSAGISGTIVFREWGPWARMGLWNCFTVATVVTAVWLRRNCSLERQGAALPDRRELRDGTEGPWSVTAKSLAVLASRVLALLLILCLVCSGLVSWGLWFGLIVAGSFIFTWIVWRDTFPRETRIESIETEGPGSAQVKGLALLTSAFVLLFIFLVVRSGLDSLAVYVGVISGELLIATWAVRHGALLARRTKVRLSPVVLVPLALLAPPVLFWKLFPSSLTLGDLSGFVSIEGFSPFLMVVASDALSWAGLVLLIGLFIRKRLHTMTYRTVFLTIVPVFWVLAWIYAHGAVLPIIMRGGDEATVPLAVPLVPLTLFLGILIVRRELVEPSIKAICFGVVFSIAFVLLSVPALGVLDAFIRT